jgi:hypothetical protein
MATLTGAPVLADVLAEPAVPVLAAWPDVVLAATLFVVELEPQAASPTTATSQTARSPPVRARKRRWCRDMQIPFIRCG